MHHKELGPDLTIQITEEKLVLAVRFALASIEVNILYGTEKKAPQFLFFGKSWIVILEKLVLESLDSLNADPDFYKKIKYWAFTQKGLDRSPQSQINNVG